MTKPPIPTSNRIALVALWASITATHLWMVRRLRCDPCFGFVAVFISFGVVAFVFAVLCGILVGRPRAMWKLVVVYWVLVFLAIWPLVLLGTDHSPWWWAD